MRGTDAAGALRAPRRPRARAACLLATVACSGVGLSVLSPAAAAASPGAGQDPLQRYVVQFSAVTGPEEGAREVRASGGQVDQVLERVFPGAVVRLSPQAAAALERSPRVARVEPDQQFRTADTQSSPPWGLDRLDQRALPLSGAYGYTATGAGVTAFVVDSGIRSDHADLEGRVGPGWTSVADGRGTGDCEGHGTHVAGTLGGRTSGVAKGVRLVPVRVLGCDGTGTTSGIVAGLEWVIGQHAAGTPAVANLSLGGGPSTSLDTAVQALVDDGVTVVVAAGNSGSDACGTSPARVPAAVTVGATDRTDSRASFSNTGRCLDLFAPGAGIVSAGHTGPTATSTLSGTSMAAPHAAGAAAVLLSAQPALSPPTVAGRLTEAATPGVVTSAGTGSPDRLLWSDPATDVGWQPLSAGPYTASSPRQGVVDLLGRGADASSVAGTWSAGQGLSAQQSLGGRVVGLPSGAAPGPDDRVVTVRGEDDQLWVSRRSGSAGWSGWGGLGGVLTSRPAAGTDSAGRVDVVARGGDGALWHRWVAGSAAWSAWATLGGQLLPGAAPATTWTGGRFEVLVVGTDRQVWRRTWTAGTGWQQWQPMGGSTQADVSATGTAGGGLVVTARGDDGATWVRTVSPVADTGWVGLGGRADGAPAVAAAPGSDEVDVLVRGTDAAPYVNSRRSGAWTGWRPA